MHLLNRSTQNLVLPLDETVIALGMELSIGSNSGALNIALPSRMMKDRFDQAGPAPDRRAEASEAEQAKTWNHLQASEVSAELMLHAGTISLQEAAAIRAGSILAIPRPVEENLVLELGGKPFYSAKVRSSQGRCAAELQERIFPTAPAAAG